MENLIKMEKELLNKVEEIHLGWNDYKKNLIIEIYSFR